MPEIVNLSPFDTCAFCGEKFTQEDLDSRDHYPSSYNGIRYHMDCMMEALQMANDAIKNENVESGRRNDEFDSGTRS